VHDDAKLMLLEHVEFLARVSPSAALKLYESIADAFLSLETWPFRYPIYDTKNTDSVYRRLIVGRYALLYTVNETLHEVNIEYIWDMRMNNEL
jgi:hypothetical protein